MPRIEIPAVMLAVGGIASLYGWALFLSTFSHPGAIGLDLNAPGTDWMVFYGAARSFFAGKLDLIFDGEDFTGYLNATFSDWLSKPLPYRPWVYPPTYLLLLLPFGKLTFSTSYFAFQLLSAVLLALVLSWESDRPLAAPFVICCALLCPAASINVSMGQNAFLSSALLVGGWRVSRRYPVLGGAILAMLAVKPQFGLLVPVALIAARQLRAVITLVATAAAFFGASIAVFGLDVWRQWIDVATTFGDPQGKWMENGRMWGDSVYACMAALGASAAAADWVQGAAMCLSAAFVYYAFRQTLPGDHKLAVLLAATILAAPHSSLHDAVLLAIASLLWVCDSAGISRSVWKWPLAGALWLAPLFNPPLISLPGRLTPVVIIAFIVAVLAHGNRLNVASSGEAEIVLEHQ
jgi:alpha-1,2-mannosyltransferase